MFPELTPDQLELRAELRAYFSSLMSPAERADLLTERHGAVYREVARRMGRDRWLGVGWPTRFGGRGFGPVERHIFADEAARADVPLPAVTLQTVGPTLQEHGTAWQQEFFLPPILAGEVHFAIGYTEPEAGTDLAALRTRAVRAAAARIAAAGESRPRAARDPVNLPMIRNWTEAIGPANLGDLGDLGGGDLDPAGPDTAPPAMIQVWTMPGRHGIRADDDPLAQMSQVLDEAGYTSVVATNCDQTYPRPGHRRHRRPHQRPDPNLGI